MSNGSDHDLERLLQMRRAPRIPAGLGDRIKGEIPPLLRFDTAPRERRWPEAAALGDRLTNQWVQLAAMAAMLVTVAGSVLVFHTLSPVANRRVGLDERGHGALVEVVRPVDPSPAQAAAMRLVVIEVAVLGPDDEPRPGAAVAVQRVGAGERPLEVITDRRGKAQVAGLPPGTYRVRCTPTPGVAAGDEVTLEAGQAASLLLLLEPAG